MEETFEKILSGYTKSLQNLGHISFSYQSAGVMNDKFPEKSAGKIFFDQKNIRKYFLETRAGDDHESQYETVIAPEWTRFIRVARDQQGTPTIMSCYKSENIPDALRTLGYMNLLFGKFFFQGEHIYLPELLRRLGPNNVTLANSDHNRKEIRFVYQDYQWRMLLDAESFTLMFFENNALSDITANYFYEVLEFQNINGVVFPTKFVTITRIPSGKMAHEYSLSEVNFSTLTEKDFRFSLSLPNGTTVYMQDAPQIEHIWYDGKIVPRTDATMLAIARGGHKFMPGPDEPRFWFMGMGIFLILLACGKMAYSHFRKKK